MALGIERYAQQPGRAGRHQQGAERAVDRAIDEVEAVPFGVGRQPQPEPIEGLLRRVPRSSVRWSWCLPFEVRVGQAELLDSVGSCPPSRLRVPPMIRANSAYGIPAT